MPKSLSKGIIDNVSGPKSVDAYLAGVPEDARATLIKLRKIIQATAPNATEGISYHIPTFKYKGPLVAFAAFPAHCSFYVMSPAVMEAHRDELRSYDTAKGTIRFPVNKPLPASLVKKLVKARIEENEKA
ncbi:hypothetical protein Metho_1573 [Methanomethylovorans hollandica DSM 15978]|uniref:YdhG-like domain-containing protein n=1 Tax=Methanomethylovorans hollandica (strain DSM 15978 / NBRC 107637 / DMS1) TaxID=867904 RepID=L0KXC6_METHD|nr:DUF1801 domain-containing protein [Methanomethylovorans hollandica]AGB49771.1 hypothetical protein Metho_1573 [Methanomethylovorans hollandica DSM 15978]